MEQRYYTVSVDKYRIDYTDVDNEPRVKKLWGTEGGIKEWIAENNLSDATYKISKKGIVQTGEPIPEWRP
jgi:hypothetical protein